MTGPIARGLAAGAAGSTVLTAVTELDRALRGRDASTTPAQLVDAVAGATGSTLPGSRRERDNRRSALGALAGIGNGVTVGVLASLARAAGIRLPAPVGAVATGAAAMALTDVPVAALGLSDPRRWSAAEWATDALAHLAYGAGVQAVIDALPRPTEVPKAAAGAALTARAALLGIAAGCRSSLGLAGPALTDPTATRLRRVASVAGVVSEMTGDKLPVAPDRTAAPGLAVRLATGARGAGALADRAGANAAWPVLAGVAGAAAGSWGGLAARSWAHTRLPVWQAGLVEDAVAVALTLVACLPGRSGSRRPVLVAV